MQEPAASLWGRGRGQHFLGMKVELFVGGYEEMAFVGIIIEMSIAWLRLAMLW